MVTDGIINMLNDEIAKARKLEQDLIAHHQPDTMIQKQKGVIEGLDLAVVLLGNYEE